MSPMSVAERLGVPIEQIEQVGLLASPVLPAPETLFAQAFATGESNPQEAQLLLAAAILAQSQQTTEGRLSGTLSLIAQLVSRADPYQTLGPKGAQMRQDLFPTGWEAMTKSWDRTRYAWREGMEHLLDVRPEDQPIVQALNEITRLHPAEPEPVKVHIQEQFPPPMVAFGITILGLGLTLRTVVKEIRPLRRKKR